MVAKGAWVVVKGERMACADPEGGKVAINVTHCQGRARLAAPCRPRRFAFSALGSQTLWPCARKML